MADYGLDIFGSPSYGPAPTDTFDAAPRAVCTEYGLVRVAWVTPAGRWSMLRLVRNPNGDPLTVTDGTLLLDATPGSASTYDDTDVTAGRRYHYGVFVFAYDTQQWVNAGADNALVTRDHGYTDVLWDRLPQIYKIPNLSDLSATEQTDTPLRRFLSLFAFELDTVRTEMDTLTDLADPARVPPAVLGSLLAQLGFAVEPELDSRTNRRLGANAPGLYATKGADLSLENLATVTTGWDAHVRVNHNRILDNLDTLTDLSYGRWDTSLVRARLEVRAADSITDARHGRAYTAMISIAAGFMSASFATVGQAARMRGIPVVQGRYYAASVYVRGGGSAQINIDWYDNEGRFITTTTGPSAAPAPTNWNTRLTCNAVNPDPAPPRAVYAALRISSTATGFADELLLNAVQFGEIESTIADWGPAREAQVYLRADLVNEVRNPDGRFGVQAWTNLTGAYNPAGTTYNDPALSYNAVVLRDSGATTVTSSVDGFTYPWAGGTQSGPGDRRVVSAVPAIPVSPGQTWTVLVSLRSAALIDACPFLRLFSGQVEIGTAHFADTDFTRLGPDWIDLSFTYTAPTDGSVNAVQFSLAFTRLDAPPAAPITNGTTVDFRNVALLAAAGSEDARYFTGATPSITADYLWEGNPHQSRSHYYSQRTLKARRLKALLTEFLPNGVTGALLFGQPDLAGYGHNWAVENFNYNPVGTALSGASAVLGLQWKRALAWSDIIPKYDTWATLIGLNPTWANLNVADATTSSYTFTWADALVAFETWTTVLAAETTWADMVQGP